MTKPELRLADFTFRGMEIPAKISGLGGEQRLAIQDLVGGGRVIDVMGPCYEDPSWSGFFQGSDAVQRAKYIEYLWKQGQPLLMTWGYYRFTVLIYKFVCEFNQPYWLPYSMVVTIQRNETDPQVTVPPDPILEDVDDMSTDGLEEDPELGFDPATVKSKVDQLKETASKVKDTLSATAAQIKEMKQQVKSVQQEVTTQIASVTNSLSQIATLGGVLPSNPVIRNVTSITQNVTRVNNLAQLEHLHFQAERIDKNLLGV